MKEIRKPENQNVDESNIYDVKILTVEEINEFEKKVK